MYAYDVVCLRNQLHFWKAKVACRYAYNDCMLSLAAAGNRK